MSAPDITSRARASAPRHIVGTSRARRRGAVPALAFVGVGWIGRERMRVALESGVAEAASIVDPSTEARRAARRIAPGAREAGDLEAALAAGPDGVVIASPSALHAGQAVTALEAGVPVFCQKPLGRTADEVADVVRAAERADLPLGADFAYRRTEAGSRMRSLIAAGAIGDVFAMDFAFHNARGPDGDWFYDPALSGGGCLIDLGVHLVDLAAWLLGFPEVTVSGCRVRAGGRMLASEPRRTRSGSPAPPHGAGPPPSPYAAGDVRRSEAVEDYATAELELDGGRTVVRIACSWNLHAGRDALISADVHGTLGGLALRNVAGSFYDFRLDLSRGARRERLCSPPDHWPGRTLVAWARSVARSERFDPGARRFVRVAAAVDGLYSVAGKSA